jgi:hypothetical protein
MSVVHTMHVSNDAVTQHVSNDADTQIKQLFTPKYKSQFAYISNHKVTTVVTKY